MSVSITPFLWYDDNAEEAIARYCSVFPQTEIISTQRNPDNSFFIGEIRTIPSSSVKSGCKDKTSSS